MRATKRSRLNIQGASRDSVLEDGHTRFVRHREQGLTSRGLVSRISGVSKQGSSAFKLTPSENIWLPEDDTQIGLEIDDVTATWQIDHDVDLPNSAPKAKPLKSRLAVSLIAIRSIEIS